MGAVNTTYTFTATDTITSTKMNNIIDQTTITTDAVTGDTLEVVAPGKLRVKAGKITSNELAANAVTTNKINNSAVTTDKIADSTSTTTGITTAKIANNAITEVKISNGSVTPAKLSQPFTLSTAQSSTSGTNIDFTSIPSWVKRITILCFRLSFDNAVNPRFRLGTSSGFVTSGYSGSQFIISGGSGSSFLTGGFDLYNAAPNANTFTSGKMVFENVGGNKWIANGDFENSIGALQKTTGYIELSESLNSIRVTSTTGTALFDNGTINISYE